MNDYEKDPFEKFDKLFDEADRKSVVQPTREKKKPTFDHSNDPHNTPQITQDQKAKAIRVIITVFLVVLGFQFIPVLFLNSGFTRFSMLFPVFSFVIIIVIINILIKVFKR